MGDGKKGLRGGTGAGRGPSCLPPPPANTWRGLRARVPPGGAAVARLWAVAVETRVKVPPW